MILRGVCIAALLIMLSPFIPALLNITDITFNYALLAFVPLIKGFSHLDPSRFHREHNFKISAKIGLIADTLSISIALLCAFTLKSYWAFYISFIFRHTIETFLTHIWAIRPYRISINFNYCWFLKILWNRSR